MTKQCNKCGVDLVVGENWTAGRERKGDYICRACHKVRTLAWRKANPEKVNSSRVAWWRANPERRAKYMVTQKPRDRAWRKANPGKVNAITAKRRALKKAQTPSWYCHATVTEIYEVAREFGYEVDHIVPLSKGGLHSHENLQLLTPLENASKGASQ